MAAWGRVSCRRGSPAGPRQAEDQEGAENGAADPGRNQVREREGAQASRQQGRRRAGAVRTMDFRTNQGGAAIEAARPGGEHQAERDPVRDLAEGSPPRGLHARASFGRVQCTGHARGGTRTRRAGKNYAHREETPERQ